VSSKICPSTAITEGYPSPMSELVFRYAREYTAFSMNHSTRGSGDVVDVATVVPEYLAPSP